MKRREFIGLVGGVAVWPMVARAQQPAMPVIGLINPGGPRAAQLLAAFGKGLSETGFVEGRNVAIVMRSAEQFNQLPALVAEMIDLQVRVIVTNGNANAAFRVLTSTNVNLPLAQWTRLATNVFDNSGYFTFTNTISPNVPALYYRLESP